MSELDAVRLALHLFHVPTGVRAARTNPLPEGVPLLLEIAAGDDAIANDTANKLERTAEVVREAAAFFIEQILLAPDGDSYRVLGGERQSTDAQLRRNMALIMRWLHPDVDRAGARSVYAGRVTRAWETLKTSDRRSAYDIANPPRQSKPRSHRRSSGGNSGSRGMRLQKMPGPPHAAGDSMDERPGLLRRTLRLLFGRNARRGQ